MNILHRSTQSLDWNAEAKVIAEPPDISHSDLDDHRDFASDLMTSGQPPLEQEFAPWGGAHAFVRQYAANPAMQANPELRELHRLTA